MRSLWVAARDLADTARELQGEIEIFGDPPSRQQIEAIQNSINKVQRRLNRIQTENDASSDKKESV
jgi:hypothetical protein